VSEWLDSGERDFFSSFIIIKGLEIDAFVHISTMELMP